MADNKEALPVVAWSYIPSDVWADVVYTDDPEKVKLAREYGREVTQLTDHATATAAIAELRAEVERLKAECDAIAELNHAQWLALENVRLLAARNRKEDWGQHMLRFCEEAGNSASAIHRSAARAGTKALAPT